MKKLLLLLAFVMMTDVLSAYDAIVARGRQLGSLQYFMNTLGAAAVGAPFFSSSAALRS